MVYIQQISSYINKSTWLESLLHEIALSQRQHSNSCNSSEKYSSLMHSHTHCQSVSSLQIHLELGQLQSGKKLNLTYMELIVW